MWFINIATFSIIFNNFRINCDANLFRVCPISWTYSSQFEERRLPYIIRSKSKKIKPDTTKPWMNELHIYKQFVLTRRGPRRINKYILDSTIENTQRLSILSLLTKYVRKPLYFMLSFTLRNYNDWYLK